MIRPFVRGLALLSRQTPGLKPVGTIITYFLIDKYLEKAFESVENIALFP